MPYKSYPITKIAGLFLAFYVCFGMDFIFAQTVLSVEISDDTGASRVVQFGFDESATNGYDSGIDQLAPPPAPFGVFDVRLTGGPFDLYRDVRPYSENATTWTLQITPANGATQVVLNWEFNPQFVSRGTTLQAGAQSIHMRDVQNTTLPALTQLVEFSFDPPVEIQTILQGTEGFRLFSAPYKWMHIRDVTNSLWTQGFQNATTPAGDPNVFYWDEAASTFIPAEDGFTEITPARGLTVFVYDDDDYDGIPDGFPKVLTHQGYMRTDNVSVPLGWSGDEATLGWNLVGNPFEEPLLLAELTIGADYQHLAPYYYVWNPEANDHKGAYLIFEQGGAFIPGISFDGIIQPSQAFWVRAIGANPELTLKREHLQATRGEKMNTDDSSLLFRLQANGLTGHTAIFLSDDPNRKNVPFLGPLRSEWLELVTIDTDSYSTIRYENPIDSEEIIIPMDILTNLSGVATLWYELSPAMLTQSDSMLCDVLQDVCHTLQESGSIDISLHPDSALIDKITIDKNHPSQQIINPKNVHRFEIVIQPKSTVVDENHDLPEIITLAQNYPNPFNPTTNITYALPESGNVRLDVFNVMGQRVATLVNDQKPAGYHTVTFDASRLASGTYLYRLQAGNQVITKKLLLIK